MNQTQNFTKDIKWVLPSAGAWWICSQTGLTLHLSTTILNNNKSEFCVQISVVPRTLLHKEETMYVHWGNIGHNIKKREPFTAIMIATLIGLGVSLIDSHFNRVSPACCFVFLP